VHLIVRFWYFVECIGEGEGQTDGHIAYCDQLLYSVFIIYLFRPIVCLFLYFYDMSRLFGVINK